MCLWLALWTVGCAMMLRKLVINFEWSFLLFSIPFFVAEIAVGAILAWGLIGRQRLTIDRTGAEVRWSIFSFSRRKFAPLRSLRYVEEYEWGEEDSTPICGVRLHTTDGPLTFAYGSDDDERHWLLDTIERHLATLGIRQTVSTRNPGITPIAPRATAAAYTGPTSGDRWKVEDQIRFVTLTTRGRFNPLAVAVAMIICLFWNAIIGVAIIGLFASVFMGKPPVGNRWIGVLFLLPFVIVGACIFGMWLSLLLAPWTTVRWTLDANSLVRRTRAPLWWWTSHWPVSGLTRTDRDVEAKATRTGHAVLEGRTWRIRLISGDAHAAEITNLTEAQAAAFEDAIRRRFVRERA